MFSSPWRQKTAFSAVLLFGVRTEPKCTKTDFKDWVGPNMRPYAQCKLKRPSASLQHSKRLSKPTSKIPKWTESENSGNAIHPNCDKHGTNTHSAFARSKFNIRVNMKTCLETLFFPWFLSCVVFSLKPWNMTILALKDLIWRAADLAPMCSQCSALWTYFELALCWACVRLILGMVDFVDLVAMLGIWQLSLF
jgi:hypothetical protein